MTWGQPALFLSGKNTFDDLAFSLAAVHPVSQNTHLKRKRYFTILPLSFRIKGNPNLTGN